MTNILYGSIGVIAVLVLLFIGAFLGWKLRVAYDQHNRNVVREGVTEEQIRRFHADQEAFSAMINYSPETAYGLPSAQDKPRKE